MKRDYNLPLAMACLLLTAILGLWLRPLLPIDETRYLDVAWEMHLSGDWLVPTKNFGLYSDKPPLLFWTINLVWLVTGVSEFAARLVGPLFGCAALWLTAVLARRLWPEHWGIGGEAALALTGLIAFGLSASLTMFDVPLTVFTLIGLIALCDAGRADAGRLPWVMFGIAIAFGVLTKGSVILFHLMPAAILLPIWGSASLAPARLARQVGLSLLVALGVLAIWLVPAIILGGAEYRDAILWHQSAGRLTESFAHARPWWFFLALLPVFAFPLFWSIGLWKSLIASGRVSDRGLRLCAIWMLSALILFSLTSGKQLHYLVPELPALALIAARAARDVPGFRPLPAIAMLGLTAIVPVLVILGVISAGELAPLLIPRTALLTWTLLILAICVFGAQQPGLRGAMVLALGILTATNILIGTTGLGSAYSAQPLATLIAPHEQDGLAMLGGTYHAEFNFAGRLTQPVAILADAAARESWMAAHPNGLMFGRVDEDPLSWPPRDAVSFRNTDWGIWSAADASAANMRNPLND